MHTLAQCHVSPGVMKRRIAEPYAYGRTAISGLFPRFSHEGDARGGRGTMPADARRDTFPRCGRLTALLRLRRSVVALRQMKEWNVTDLAFDIAAIPVAASMVRWMFLASRLRCESAGSEYG